MHCMTNFIICANQFSSLESARLRPLVNKPVVVAYVDLYNIMSFPHSYPVLRELSQGRMSFRSGIATFSLPTDSWKEVGLGEKSPGLFL